ncbi:MAG: hypothetical protein GY931_09900 [Maribacter sp.]|nr:hypothetical protein [Maribacter sp.]
MKKDIEIPIVKDVYIAMVYEWNDKFKTNKWNAYILNDGTTPIAMVFVVSKGFLGDTKTATMRHSMEVLEANSFQKLEFVQREVLDLTNEFYVTYYLKAKLYEKRFIFKKESVSEENLTQIPLMDKLGILAE